MANCIAAIKCLRHYTKLIWEHKFPPSLTPLSSKTRIEWPPASSTNRKFSERTYLYFSLFFKHFSRIVDLVIQFCFRCKVSFHEKWRPRQVAVAWFYLTNHSSLLGIASNEFAPFCIDNRLRKIAFWGVDKVGKGQLSGMCKDIGIK